MAKKPLDPNLWILFDVFKSVYSVPVYQRPYSWEFTQINMLMDDIITAYNNKSDNEEGYFIGSIYIYDLNNKINGLIETYDIIDGQQRLTTVFLMLLSIYSIAIKLKIPSDNPTFAAIKSSVWKCYGNDYTKDIHTLTLNSLEKKCFKDICDRCFDDPQNIKEYCENYVTENKFEARVKDNFLIIYNKLANKCTDCDTLLDFSRYLLYQVQLISIDSSCSIGKAFSIFESINSKGKPLDEIDKIKTYIFAQLDEDSYDKYLEIWGNLIKRTNDQLYDYLYIYIKAYIYFYRQSIYIDNFKALSNDALLNHFNKDSVKEALKALLDDMYSKVEFYEMLIKPKKAIESVKSSEFTFFYTIFTQINYKHPKPLFFRCFQEYKQGNLDKPGLINIIRETVKFMFEFLTISDKDSKDAITMFSVIMNEVYIRGQVEERIILNVIANELISKGITVEKLKLDIATMDAFEQDKKTAVALLSLYEATTVEDSPDNGNKIVRTSYDHANTLLSKYGDTISLDHLLVQTPAKDSEFKYYSDDNNKLVLKEGHDFDSKDVVDGMEYDQFKRVVLNKIGNLRLLYRDDNSSRGNEMAFLKEYEGFITYKQITDREEMIINVLMEHCLPMPEYDPTLKAISQMKENALPKINELIEYGLICPDDKLYIVDHKDDSEAVLINGKYVKFNDEKMKISDWVNKITGLKRANIYTSVARSGEDETLHQKRIKYLINSNEESFD